MLKKLKQWWRLNENSAQTVIFVTVFFDCIHKPKHNIFYGILFRIPDFVSSLLTIFNQNSTIYTLWVDLFNFSLYEKHNYKQHGKFLFNLPPPTMRQLLAQQPQSTKIAKSIIFLVLKAPLLRHGHKSLGQI